MDEITVIAERNKRLKYGEFVFGVVCSLFIFVPGPASFKIVFGVVGGLSLLFFLYMTFIPKTAIIKSDNKLYVFFLFGTLCVNLDEFEYASCEEWDPTTVNSNAIVLGERVYSKSKDIRTVFFSYKKDGVLNCKRVRFVESATSVCVALNAMKKADK